jgi:nucleotidyltransferase/DNA polymerase involved in DNA repair
VVLPPNFPLYLQYAKSARQIYADYTDRIEPFGLDEAWLDVSGAGGVQPGMLMGQRDTLADGQHPVALTGRVYAWADAAHGAIEPGDLLTTSDVRGHVMKVSDHQRAQGAVIGKAMSRLESGRGLVLVLVSLQ